MDLTFDTDYHSILVKLDKIDPIEYGKTRNYVDGAVTYLSPYISRGVISTKQILRYVLDKGYEASQIQTFVKELCWRDYFQRVGQTKDLNKDIRQAQTSILNYEISSQIVHGETGIESIDNAIKQLYRNGYVHNHGRMYLASLTCNIAKSNWYHPAQWMYYHLLDGDWASNACSWQWVAGANSHKKYFANQENINKFTCGNQVNTYLDKPYEELETMVTPTPLLNTEKYNLAPNFPVGSILEFDRGLPTFVYNYYNLDPLWHKDEQSNRVLLIEPEFFKKYPVSKKCIDFMLDLSKNISGMQVYTGSFKAFTEEYEVENIYYKEHPFNEGYVGQEEQRDWIAEEVTGYFPSFFSYWKKMEKFLNRSTFS